MNSDRFFSAIDRGRHLAADILFPRTCVGCGTDNTVVCGTCWGRWVSPHFESWRDDGLDQIISFGAYSGLFVQYLIQRWKFAGDRSVAQSVAPLMTNVLRNELLQNNIHSSTCDTSVFVPIPLHEKKLRERGFNQAEDLARELASQLETDYSPLLHRIKYTQPQKSLAEGEKVKNLKSAFAVHPIAMQNRDLSTHIFLVDDIATTGTTLKEAASVLRSAGFQHISAVVIARG